MILELGTFIVFAGGRISTHHKEMLARGEALVASSCRQDSDITGFKGKRPASFATELHLAGPSGDAEHFVYLRMVVYVVVDAIAPGIPQPFF